MQVFFTLHPGEFLVGDHVTRRLKYDVWVPAKDTGVDLLLTPRGKSKRAIKLQVKFSRSYDGDAAIFDTSFVARGWYSLDRAKIRRSKANFWIFVMADLRRKVQFVVVPIANLRKRIRGRGGKWNLYLTICDDGAKTKCFDTRDLSDEEQIDLFAGDRVNRERDYKPFLNNWKLLEA
jgi:hypothetical protein